MPHHFALCSNIVQFHENRITDPRINATNPCSGWVAEFIKLISPLGATFSTGDIALAKIRSGKLAPEDTWIICDMDSHHAHELRALGAHPLVIYTFESPLYARTFYQHAAELCRPYAVKLVFSGLMRDALQGMEGCHRVKMANFDRNEPMPSIEDWGERSLLGLVAGNKYWRTPFSWDMLTEPKKLESWFRGKFRFTTSPLKRMARDKQLLDERLRLIEYFGTKNVLKLYGRGWTDRRQIPRYWHRLIPMLKGLDPQPCDDKIAALASCKFTLCLENARYPGYLTEKLIDCFFAGSIPIYLGDPEVDQVIPKEAYIDLAEFDSYDSLFAKMQNMTVDESRVHLQAGRAFLSTEVGQGYSHQGFAEDMLRYIRPHLSPSL